MTRLDWLDNLAFRQIEKIHKVKTLEMFMFVIIILCVNMHFPI